MTIKNRAADHDDDGNNLTPPKADSDVGQLIYLLEWGRQRGFQIGPTIQIGTVIVQVRDQRSEGSRPVPETDIFEEHGYTEKE